MSSRFSVREENHFSQAERDKRLIWKTEIVVVRAKLPQNLGAAVFPHSPELGHLLNQFKRDSHRFQKPVL
jgi:hypothetical protein